MLFVQRKLLIFIFSLLLGSIILYPQSNQDSIDPLVEFQELESAANKLKFFTATQNRYTKSSAYDWLESVKVYLDSAEKINDSSAMYSYRLMQAQLYNDIGDFDKSI